MSKSSQAAAVLSEKSTYDEVPYENSSHPLTHPDQIAVIASLFSLTPAKLETARVLELGCAAGGNILPLAFRYPKASFTGLDLSQRQIDFANEQREALGLKNIAFKQQDIMTFDLKKNKGSFDYIIAHGVYSWVPEEVAARTLDICRECLSDNGLAVVSYNTLPGWNAVRSLRDMMLYHTKNYQGTEKVQQSRQLLDFLAGSATPENGYKALLEGEQALLRGRNDSYIFHDHLESVNRQFYFHEFAEALQKHGLAYVGDSSVTTMFVGNLPPKAAESLSAIKDLVQQEQYIDFVMNRRFRTSVICKSGAAIKRDIPSAKILDYYLTAGMRPVDANPDCSKPVKFVSNDGKASFTANLPLFATIFHEIFKSGNRPISIDDLTEKVRKRLPDATSEAVRAVLLENGMRLALGGFLTLHMNSPAFESKVNAKPVANPFARLQAQRAGCKSVTSLTGGMISLDGLACMVVALLDGKNTVDDVVASLVQDALDGEITVADKGEAIKDKAVLTVKLKEVASNVVSYLAQEAVLTA